VSAFQLHVNVTPGFVNPIFESDKPVIHEDNADDEHNYDNEQYYCHILLSPTTFSLFFFRAKGASEKVVGDELFNYT
jgi:hypothetical protein